MEGDDFDLINLRGLNVMGLAQLERCLNRWLGPAAHRIGFEILLAQVPICAKILPVFRRLLDGQRRGAGKAAKRQFYRRNPGHSAPACAVFEHCGVVNAAHHLAARAVVFCNPERVSCLVRGQVCNARASGSRSGGTPTARGMIVGHCAMLRHRRPRAKLITHNQAV